MRSAIWRVGAFLNRQSGELSGLFLGPFFKSCPCNISTEAGEVQTATSLSTAFYKISMASTVSSDFQGLYLLGNDAVLGQMQAIVAALLSGDLGDASMPICIIPFDEQMEETEDWIARHDQISLFSDTDALRKWETFYEAIWASQPVVNRLSQRYALDYGNVHYARKFCAFDGPFQRFVVYDAVRGAWSQSAEKTTLPASEPPASDQPVSEQPVFTPAISNPAISNPPVSNPPASGVKQLASNLAPMDFLKLNLPQFLEQLDRYDLIVEDWEWLKPSPRAVMDLAYVNHLCVNSDDGDCAWVRDPQHAQVGLLRNRLHGAQFFAAQARLFTPEMLTQLCQNLIEGEEIRWINSLRWWDEAALFSYMTLRIDARILNRTRAKAAVHPLMAFEQALSA